MNVNELKAYIEGLLAAESDTVPRDAVVRIREMVDKLPSQPVLTVTTTGGGGWCDGKPIDLTKPVWSYAGDGGIGGTIRNMGGTGVDGAGGG